MPQPQSGSPPMALGVLLSTVRASEAKEDDNEDQEPDRHRSVGAFARSRGRWIGTREHAEGDPDDSPSDARLPHVIDNDVMPHKLVQLAGPAAKLISPAMNHMSAQAKIVFAKSGTFRFTTKAGEDYPNMTGMKTMGEDNV